VPVAALMELTGDLADSNMVMALEELLCITVTKSTNTAALPIFVYLLIRCFLFSNRKSAAPQVVGWTVSP